jgi:hypothetical protein
MEAGGSAALIFVILRFGPDAVVRLVAGLIAAITKDKERGERCLKVLRILRGMDDDDPPPPLPGSQLLPAIAMGVVRVSQAVQRPVSSATSSCPALHSARSPGWPIPGRAWTAWTSQRCKAAKSTLSKLLMRTGMHRPQEPGTCPLARLNWTPCGHRQPRQGCAFAAASIADRGSHPSFDQVTFPAPLTRTSHGWSCTPYPSARRPFWSRPTW